MTLGIRPEDITLVAGDDPAAITAEVSVVEPLGDSSLVYFDLGSTTCTASMSGELSIQSGDRLHVTFPEERIHLFDRESGVAIKHREYTPTAPSNQSINV
ncbi:TOBE domain-containing protein [Natronobiforma cellulositropha]|uniref:TOBE domain-containing protein n=1 Tax=Natronobiforma cellulositropha TaxID=1679076 RepID=UPI0021D5D333|nr:TOBE domain-containing protein [Natronobiforma cellulositropha]